MNTQSPASSDPIVFATLDYTQATGVGTVASLSEIISTNPVETRREWNGLREAGAYYSEEFPHTNP